MQIATQPHLITMPGPVASSGMQNLRHTKVSKLASSATDTSSRQPSSPASSTGLFTKSRPPGEMLCGCIRLARRRSLFSCSTRPRRHTPQALLAWTQQHVSCRIPVKTWTPCRMRPNINQHSKDLLSRNHLPSAGSYFPASCQGPFLPMPLPLPQP